MIPIRKLERLPRHQALRKICKIFIQAEQRLSVSGEPGFSLDYLREIAGFLIRDMAFSGAVLREIRGARDSLDLVSPGNGNLPLVRACNTLRHILLSETGQPTADWDFIDHQGNLDPFKRRVFPGMKVYLEDIRSPFNVGSMFRTAESFGVETVLLSPLCADPDHPRAQRTAMGCVSIVPWRRINLEDMEGPLLVLETGGIDLEDFMFPDRGTMIVGSEELGASPRALERAEKSLGRVSIQTYGAKGSLNAGVAFGIALHAWAGQLNGRCFP